MSSISPSNDPFLLDPPEFAVGPNSSAAPAPDPLAEPTVAPVAPADETVAPAPAPTPAPTHEPAPEPPPAAASAEKRSTSMRDVLLGTLIVRAGLVAEEQLEDALQEGMRSGKRLGEVLLKRGWLHERDLARLLAGQKGLPFVEIRASDAEPAALRMLPEEKARLQLTLPLRQHEGQLVVAVADPSNELALENLRRTVGVEPRLVVAPRADLIRAIDEAYADLASGAQEPSLELNLEQPLEPEPPVAQEPSPDLQPSVQAQPTDFPAQPAAAAVVMPLMPLLLPPAQSADAQPAAPPPEQPVEAVEQPLPAEPMTPALPTTEAAPAPSAEQPAPTVHPEAIAPPVPSSVETEPPQPMEPVLATPVPEALPESAAVSSAEAEAPAPEEPAAESFPSEEPSPGPASSHVVLLRLHDGETLEVGTFQAAPEAFARAQGVVRQITKAEGDADWPFIAERYLRPDTIVSVDLIEGPAGPVS